MFTLPSPPFRIDPVSWQGAYDALRTIRAHVFIDEQGVAPELEWDDDDAHAMHSLATANGTPIGTARLVIEPHAIGRVGRMAVMREWRGRGVGQALLMQILTLARRSELHALYLHAQTHAIDFYARHGFVIEGDEFMEAGIAHRTMRLKIIYT